MRTTALPRNQGIINRCGWRLRSDRRKEIRAENTRTYEPDVSVSGPRRLAQPPAWEHGGMAMPGTYTVTSMWERKIHAEEADRAD